MRGFLAWCFLIIYAALMYMGMMNYSQYKCSLMCKGHISEWALVHCKCDKQESRD